MMKEQKRVFSLILFLVICSLTSQVRAQSSYNYDCSFELNLYAPAKVSIQFAYTLNFSVSNVITLSGQSLWTATTSPVGIEFNVGDIDTYNFDVDLVYGEVVDQIVQVGFWSGTLAPNSIPIRFNKSEVTFHFKLTVIEQPRPPTPEEVAAATELMIHQDIQYYMDQITLLTRSFEANITTMWVIVAFTAIFGITSLIVSAYTLMSRRRD